MKRSSTATQFWTALPVLRIGSSRQTDTYRLCQGHVEFRPAGTRRWRRLAYTEVEHHFALDTPVGRWLAKLYSGAKLAKVLAMDAQI